MEFLVIVGGYWGRIEGQKNCVYLSPSNSDFDEVKERNNLHIVKNLLV